jgi:hypothetical protein
VVIRNAAARDDGRPKARAARKKDEPAKKERPKKARPVPPWLQPYQANPPESPDP